ncbi:MAG: sensory histidine kinase AtoS [Methanomassiliicoccales archaeon PtaU1.Bin124]|nr:MAG: sensory histidine kinase AtoS [Methanomassiliicoccales archaeon PtaU1.Bin124]
MSHRDNGSGPIPENDWSMAHMSNLPMAVVEWDQDYRVARWTGEAERMFGWNENETLGKGLLELGLTLPENAAKVREAMSRLKDGSTRHWVASTRNLTKSGKVIDCTWYNSLLSDGTKTVSVMSLVVDNTAMVNAERALKESEYRLRTVMDNSLDGINMLDLTTGRYVVLSPAQVEMTGMTREELLGMTAEKAYRLTHPDDREITISQQKRVLEGKDDGSPVEYRWLVNGEYRWFSDRRKLVYNADGDPVAMVGLSRDITEQKKTEEAIVGARQQAEEERARLSTVLDQMPLGMVIADPNGKLLMGNKRLDEICRFPMLHSASIKEYPQWVAFDPADNHELSAEERPMAIALMTGKVSGPKEVILKRGDGTLGTVMSSAAPIRDSSGNLIGGVSVIWDISERKEIERELTETKARLETVLGKLPVAVIVVSAPDGKMVYCNEEVGRHFRIEVNGVPRENIFTGYPIYHLDGSQYIVEEYPTVRAMRTGEMVYNEIIEYERSDGTRGYANANAVPIKDANGNVTSVIGLRIDISNEIMAQKGLARSNAELQQFAYIASHDLQEPLRMVMSYVSLLKKKHQGSMNDEARQYVDNIMTGGERMRELVNDLLTFSRIESQTKAFSKVDMNEVVGSIIALMGPAITECDAKIKVDSLPSIHADEMQMSQVVMNLVSNALKFRRKVPLHIEIYSLTGPREWIFAVRDDGIGIDPMFSDKLFQMFQRLHTMDDYPGTGMGLAISKKIVERHGGRIWFESTPGSGSTFYFSVPKAGQ